MSYPRTTEIGFRIRAARRDAGLSLTDLATKTGCMQKSAISNYEQGMRRPGLEQAEILARALGVSARWLLAMEKEA